MPPAHTGMAEHVEARSLAELNYLASHPPQYPTNPTEKKQDPLVLYISRVPGTRDIILSPFKPHVKNVTAEDVASSLYYVHFDSPGDDLLVPPDQAAASSSPRSSSESRRTQIQRKPVPSATKLKDIKPPLVDPATHTLHPALRPDGPEGQAYGDHVQSAPALDPNYLLSEPQGEATNAPIQRKPLGPRSMATDDNQNTILAPTPMSNPPPLPPRPSQQENIPFSTEAAPNLSPSPLAARVPMRSPSPPKHKFKPFSLTLIRRDRTSDEQWNVGKIASFQIWDPDHLSDDRHYQPSPSILIHIETSGYAKFRNMPTRPSVTSAMEIRQSLDTLRPRSAGAGSVSRLGDELLQLHQQQQQQQPQQHQHPAVGGFEVQVKMAYSPSWTTNLKHALNKRRRSSGSPTSPPGPGARPSSHTRHGSAASARSLAGENDTGSGVSCPPDSSRITQPAPGLKPRGYTFMSPWGGECKFATGNGGRSLECRHVLPNFTGNVFNPLVEGGADAPDKNNPKGGPGGGGGGGGAKKHARPVSELRFNLPTSEVLFKDNSNSNGTSHSHSHSNNGNGNTHGYTHGRSRRSSTVGEGAQRAREQLQGQFQKLVNKAANAIEQHQHQHQHQHPSDDEAADWKLDLSLGREKAGGGNRGSRAKLGKLVIAEDGLKMLDLVVAANVGVWWTSWERTFGDTS